MSCDTLNLSAIQLNVSAGSLPEGFCPLSLQNFFDVMTERLIISPSTTFNTFAIGTTAPSSNIGPWLKDCSEWFVFDDATATYIPVTKGGFNTQQLFIASGTFTVPDFIYKLKVTCWGGGGGGANAGGAAGAGGGGGAFAQTILTVTPGQAIAVTIGAGGVNGSPGTAGGATTFSTLSAGGGFGGVAAAGGNGGSPSGHTLGIIGGAASSVVSGTGHPIGASGSSPQGGAGGVFELAGFTKINGKFPGGGGAPSDSASNAGLAGSGASGACLVEY